MKVIYSDPIVTTYSGTDNTDGGTTVTASYYSLPPNKPPDISAEELLQVKKKVTKHYCPICKGSKYDKRGKPCWRC